MNLPQSVRILLDRQSSVVESFYERFLKQYPELSHHFERRDLRMQASIVTMALLSVDAHYTHRFPATEHYLKVLGHRHYHEGIQPEDFPKFRDVLLETLKDFLQQDWDQVLHDEWYTALNLAIETMLEGYQKTYIY